MFYSLYILQKGGATLQIHDTSQALTSRELDPDETTDTAHLYSKLDVR